jgi:hypothetical protein
LSGQHETAHVSFHGKTGHIAADDSTGHDQLDRSPSSHAGGGPFNGYFDRSVRRQFVAAGDQRAAAAEVDDPALSGSARLFERAITERQVDGKTDPDPPFG